MRKGHTNVMKERRIHPRIPHAVSMSNYGPKATPAWVATMSGKLWMIMEKVKQKKEKK